MENQHQKLFSTLLFWSVLLLPAIIAGMLGGVIAWHSDLAWDLSTTGFNNFLDLFKFPLGVASLGIPFAAFVAWNHRSQQTVAQMKLTGDQMRLTQSQNNFINYFKHIEEFEKFINPIIKDKNTDTPDDFNVRTFHSHVYSELRQGVIYPPESFHEKVLCSLNELKEAVIEASEITSCEDYYMGEQHSRLRVAYGKFIGVLGGVQNASLRGLADRHQRSVSVVTVLIRHQVATYGRFLKLAHEFSGSDGESFFQVYRDHHLAIEAAARRNFARDEKLSTLEADAGIILSIVSKRKDQLGETDAKHWDHYRRAYQGLSAAEIEIFESNSELNQKELRLIDENFSGNKGQEDPSIS